ncbi:MAG: SurA N-terminal domain-containing protein [bacterium]|nr:SurA N-terminal domain-containing protein [bacterium]
MLQQMRQAQGWMIKGVLWAVVMAFVMTIFYSWGVQSSSGPTRSEVATILGVPVELREFQQVQNRLYQNYRNLFRQQPNFDLREQFNFREMALEQIANRHLLLRIAQENGLVVTDAELYDQIASNPAFQQQGRFDAAHYRTVLQSQAPAVSLQRFEQEQRQTLLLDKVRNFIRQTVQVTDAEVEQAYRWERERVAARFVALVPSLFGSDVQVTAEAVQAHYEANRDAYREPERRRIRYVAIAPSRFRTAGDVAEVDIADHYAAHHEAFRRQEQVRARHILFKVAPDAEPGQVDEIRAKAEKVMRQLRDGAEFAALAEEHSEDAATAEEGGDLGLFARGQMVKPFEEVAFALQVGAMSELVRTPFGYHIIRVEDKIEAGVKPLVEVRQEVISKIQDEKARRAVLMFVDDLIVTLEEAPEQFAALAEQHELALTVTPFVRSTGQVSGLEGVPDIGRRAFALVGQGVDTVEGANGTYYIFQVAEVKPSAIAEFTVVENRVKESLRHQRSDDLASQTADDWAAQIQAGALLSDLATQRQVRVNETQLFARNDAVPRVGRQAAFNQIAFGLRTGEAGAAHTRAQHFIIQVIDRRAADMESYEAEKATYQQQLLHRKRQQALVAFQNSLQAQYRKLRQEGEIVVNPQYVF